MRPWRADFGQLAIQLANASGWTMEIRSPRSNSARSSESSPTYTNSGFGTRAARRLMSRSRKFLGCPNQKLGFPRPEGHPTRDREYSRFLRGPDTVDGPGTLPIYRA